MKLGVCGRGGGGLALLRIDGPAYLRLEVTVAKLEIADMHI